MYLEKYYLVSDKFPAALILFLLFSLFSSAQEDFSWWTEKHNWDGVTPWDQYMTMSSAYMGPNALPVPEVKSGETDSVISLNISFDAHVSKGDKTQNIFLRGILPLFNNRLTIEMDVVPLEWYKTDTTTRDIRAARTKSGEGSAGGDIYLTTTLQILKNKKFPDVLLRYSLKTASGTHLRDARYTDAPGYYIDLSLGKSSFPIKGIIKELRCFADVGLYTYQTHDLEHLQNDCLFYGLGMTLNSKLFSLTNQLAGYSGYINNGDSPLVFRSELRWLRKNFDWSFSYQQGLHDYDYHRYRISCIVHLEAFN